MRAEPCYEPEKPITESEKRVKIESERLEKEYFQKRTVEQHQHIRTINNVGAMRMLGIAIFTYIYMGVTTLIATNL
jgi:hypothetical protein